MGCTFPLQYFKLLAERRGKRTRWPRPTLIKHVPTEFHILIHAQKMFFWDRGWKLAFGRTLVSHPSDWRFSGYKVHINKKKKEKKNSTLPLKCSLLPSPSDEEKNQRLTCFFHTVWELPHRLQNGGRAASNGASWEL